MDLLDKAHQVFGAVERPEHFTDHEHCCECAEHDETLRSHDPQSIGFNELRPGWDPICFVTHEGLQYYFPALARLALQGTGDTYFVDQLVFHMILDGRRNDRWKAFTPAQRRYVVELLEHLVETRAEEIERNGDTDSVFHAIEIWSDNGR